MVQKSILSFFSAKPARGAEGTSDAGGSRRTTSEDSPVKRSVKRRSRVIDSDNEEEEEEEVETSGEDGGRGKGPKEGENGRISEEEEEKEEEKENVMSNKVKKKTAVPKKGKSRNVKTEVTAEDDGKGDGDQNSDGAKDKVRKEKCEEEGEMEVEDGAEESEMKDISEDRSKKKELEEEEEGSSSSSSATSEKESQPPLSNSPGFSPETIPPLRRTAERQLKRKSGGMEEEQAVKKQKKQEEEEEEEEEGVKEEKASQKEKTRKLIKSESDEEENMENNKKGEKGDKKEDKEDDGTEGKKSSPAGRPKPAAFHSFFTAMKGSAGKNTPTETTSKTKEEENFSSPQKRKREEGRGKTATRAKIEEGKSEKSKESPKKKEDKKDDSDETSTVDTFKEEKEEEEENKDGRKSTKTNSPQKEEEEEKEKKEDKKITVNPFAQKTPGSAGDDPGAEYNPKKGNYHPIKDAFWKNGQKVPYLALAKTLEAIEETSGRLKIVEILANFLRSVIVLSPDDLLFCVYLCLNKVAPAFEGLELRIGSTILIRAIAQASGRSAEKIKADAERLGDLGVVAEMSRSNQRVMMQPAKLTVPGVFHKLKEIALMTGHASQAKKVELVKGMYVACRFCEAKYLIRSLGGKLRVGLAEQSVLQAIAQACYLTPPGQKYPPEVLDAGAGRSGDKVKAEIDEYALILKTTYCEFPSYDKIIPVLLKEGVEELPKHCSLTPGVPLKPMLAHPTTGISEVLKRFDNKKFTCEFKYDGERAQIHMQENGTINIYSRNQEDNTSKYPDIISRFKNSIGENVKSCVIDSEAVAWDREKKRILPFQVLSTRKKKDAKESQITVQVCVFPFDLLYLNGEPLVREPFERRRALLRENFTEVEGEFVFAQSMDATNTEDIEEFLEESIKGNCEGLMVKTLDVEATYEIAKRSRNWLKLKKDYLDGVGDTIDAVVIGGYLGKGKRAGNYGGFLLACYDEDNEEYQSLCKIGTGFSDEDLSKHTEFFKKHIIQNPKSYYRYDSAVEPDHWFDAVQVWEVKCADLSISPVHKAAQGIVDPEKGISLRFPRFLRIRDDKNPEAATSASQIAELYKSQEQIKNSNTDAAADDEDYY